MDMNIRFCQLLLKDTIKLLTNQERIDYRANVGVTCSKMGNNSKHYFFEWPHRNSETGGTFRWEDEADNAYDARAKALHVWLDKHAAKFRAGNVLAVRQVWRTNADQHVRIAKTDERRVQICLVHWNGKAWKKKPATRLCWVDRSEFNTHRRIC